jgi:type I restriction enzyme S subunit
MDSIYPKRLLGDLVEILTDGTHHSPKTTSGPYLYITSKNVKFGCLDLNNVSYIAADEHEPIFQRCPVKKGDLLLTKDGASTGNAAINILDKPFSLLSSVALIRGKKGILNNNYLLQYILSTRGQYLLKSEIEGQAITRLTLKKISKFPVPLPSYQEQITISEFLSIWDAAIEKTELLIAAKEAVKNGLLQRLVFGKVRMGGRKNSGIAEGKWFSIPSDWKRAKIGLVAKEVSRKNTNGDSLPVLSCTKHQGLVDSLEYFDKQVFSKDTSTYKVVQKGQFAYATNHIEEGSIGYQSIYPKGLISPMYTVFTTDPKKINDGYLYKLLKTETYRRIFAINTNASVDRRGSLRWKDFAKLPIPLPSLSEQERIDEVLSTAQQEIDLLQIDLELLKKQKRGLMQKLLTGQWRVKV